jgi:diguanylate cyclase (GGDEF)-like protein
MSAADTKDLDPTRIRKILLVLDALRLSPTGSLIYAQIERMLEELVDERKTMERAYLALVNRLLEAYRGHLRDGSVLQIQVRLLQARLQPPLSIADLGGLHEYVVRHANEIDALKQLDSSLFQQAIAPLLDSFGIAAANADELPEENLGFDETLPVDVEQPGDQTVPVTSFELYGDTADADPADTTVEEVSGVLAPEGRVAQREQPRYTQDEFIVEAARGDVAASVSSSPDNAVHHEVESPVSDDENGHVNHRVDTAYRSHLDSKSRDIQKLQSTLSRQVMGTIAQNEEFGVLLEVVLGELRQADDGKELEDLRWTLIREIEKLTKGHHELAEQLDSTHHYLQLIESDSRQLNDELTRVRLLSLTDELTGLPNRRAFLRRIEDEVARVQRYGFPLSMALIDLDHFKQVNDKYGHAGGDEILKIYSKNILSIFRHHDLVARYGGEEFAVLLPNTDAEGSMRALTKVRNRSAETRWQPNGEMLPVPTFSSGVSLYKPGETAGAFIERADKALYRAKRLGRNRVELDATYHTDAVGDTPRTPDTDNDGRQRGGS